jgi:hypothetical protein
MTPYLSFKRALVDAWPKNVKVYDIAAMVMIDNGMDWKKTWNTGAVFSSLEKAADFVRSVKMPDRVGLDVSLYMAVFYPATSSLLCSGASKDVVFNAIRKEKASKAVAKKKLARETERTKYKREEKTTHFIHASSLTKKHDWHTVK